MLKHNKQMKEYLIENGVDVKGVKYIKEGSQRGIWRLNNSNIELYDNTELQEKLTELGFKSFDGCKINNFNSGGGQFQAFLTYSGSKVWEIK